MEDRFILALDEGTTSTRAILFDHACNIIGSTAEACTTPHVQRCLNCLQGTNEICLVEILRIVVVCHFETHRIPDLFSNFPSSLYYQNLKHIFDRIPPHPGTGSPSHSQRPGPNLNTLRPAPETHPGAKTSPSFAPYLPAHPEPVGRENRCKGPVNIWS